MSPTSIIVPYTSQQVKALCGTVDDWAIMLCGFSGEIGNHYPKHPLLIFFKEHPVVFPKVTSPVPLNGAPNIFTDGSKTDCGVLYGITTGAGALSISTRLPPSY